MTNLYRSTLMSRFDSFVERLRVVFLRLRILHDFKSALEPVFSEIRYLICTADSVEELKKQDAAVRELEGMYASIVSEYQGQHVVAAN